MSPPNIDFADVFSPDLASGLPEHTRINDRTIELVNANEFMRPFKSPAGALILFDRKLDKSFRLCVDYRGLKNSQSRTSTVAFGQGFIFQVEVSILTGSSLPRVRRVQPCCADNQVFIRCAQIDLSSSATQVDAQNDLTNRLIN